ncbi:MAG TPA: dephospho-CoA kinase [Microbacteriaceae bacterium]|nr:dephospho-CoA kinase [Microbacteriaceae bacterium]
MRLIGLTGGIASGKSLVSARLAELGAVVVDADALARDAVAPGSPGLQRVLAEFGERLRLPDGSLDRPALGAIVFRDAERLAALNAIVHPEVQRLASAAFAAAESADPDAIVVYDVPLLAENAVRLAPRFDEIVVVSAPEEERVRRMVEDRGMSEADARGRIRSQASEEARLAIADHVIDNSGSREATLAQVDELWRSLSDVRGHA